MPSSENPSLEEPVNRWQHGVNSVAKREHFVHVFSYNVESRVRTAEETSIQLAMYRLQGVTDSKSEARYFRFNQKSSIYGTINRGDNSEGRRESVRSMSSLPPMFNQTPQPMVSRDLKLFPPPSRKSTKQDTASLLHSSEAKRQIDSAGNFDNNSLNRMNTESMQIEELDSLEVGDLSTGDAEQIPSTYLKKFPKENHYKLERATGENGYQPKSQKPTPRGSLASESKQSPLRASNVSNPLTPMFRVEEGCGRPPPVVDALYTSQSKDYSSTTTSAETRPSDPHPFSSYLTLASSTKRPSPFARIFTPSINKLHPYDPGQRNGK
ncbi:hypothetical protein CLF_104651 [Clonorchis sinensis]|uniref:Uncharacterized protein n=1 Tax=Clonorchis sinensis TaxID=79923 RepID=G7YC16_CLOSI|nr:hypothetical protein CLF_104651 [Clonorchis sinensis]